MPVSSLSVLRLLTSARFLQKEVSRQDWGSGWLTLIDMSVSEQFMRPYLSLLWIACVRRSPRGR